LAFGRNLKTTVSEVARQEIIRNLGSGESLIWAGNPKAGLLLRPSDALMIPFSLMWGGFAIFWETTVLNTAAPGFFALWGIPFVLIGLYMIVGRFFVDSRIRGNTVYALTNRRAIIISGLFSRTTTSLPLGTLTDISLQEKTDGSGTITLGRPQPNASWMSGMRWPGLNQSTTPAFEFIAEARGVHDRLLDAQRGVA
jgi:hypothetical protein